MPKIKPTEAEIALNREIERLKQVAAHHCSAFIELSRGVEQGVVRDGRPGKHGVTLLINAILVSAVEIEVIKTLLTGSAFSAAEYVKTMTDTMAEVNAMFAEMINGNKLGLLASFAFAPVADPEPKEVDDDGGS